MRAKKGILDSEEKRPFSKKKKNELPLNGGGRGKKQIRGRKRNSAEIRWKKERGKNRDGGAFPSIRTTKKDGRGPLQGRKGGRTRCKCR